MFAVIWALTVGLVMGVLPRWRDGRSVLRRVAVALLGAYAGALLGGMAGTLLAGVTASFPWVDAGIGLGSINGAVAALLIDQRVFVTNSDG
jgi:multisubunit Na+/H+ antiporter MnhB subunit